MNNYYFDSEWCDYIIYRYYHDSYVNSFEFNYFIINSLTYFLLFLSLFLVTFDLILIFYWFLGGFYEKDFF